MKRYERLNTLLESLAEKGAIDVDELAEQLHVLIEKRLQEKVPL